MESIYETYENLKEKSKQNEVKMKTNLSMILIKNW